VELTNVTGYSVSLTQPDEKHLAAYDNTKLVAVNTCPTWGITRYQMHKTFPSKGRAMALEAGSAMHEVFAFIRLLTVMYDDTVDQSIRDSLVWKHGLRLFGVDRWQDIREQVGDGDRDEQARRGAIATLNNGPFYDDPRDKRRTLTNLEEAALSYVRRYNWRPVWVRDRSDPHSDIGVEIPFDILVTAKRVGDEIKRARFTGKIDGIHLNERDQLILGENKTSSRLDEAWSMSFHMSSQVTGYCIAASTFAQEEVTRADVLGCAIPQPRGGEYTGVTREYVEREPHHYERWFHWFFHSVLIYEQWENNPIAAPKYTHSCNRYFRPCSMIPFCTETSEEQQMILDEMVIEEWSPLHDTGEQTA
jgi:hypothetical protein